MSKSKLIIFGLGAAAGDDITVGALRRMRDFQRSGKPLFLRTERHPSVPELRTEGVVFEQSFDALYESSDNFEQVYSGIVDKVIEGVRQNGIAGYAVPGHPMIGEQTVHQLLNYRDEIDIEIVSGTSFIDACLAASRCETDGLVVLDALSLKEPVDKFRKYPSPFMTDLPQLIYQVYNRQVASSVKIALLERYPVDHLIKIITRAGLTGAEQITTTEISRLDRSENNFDHLTSLLIPPLDRTESTSDFNTLVDIMAQLRHPTKGCPWDREQSPESLKRYAVEEVYEVLDAIDDGDPDKYVEELGDLLLQVVFHAQLARESDIFAIEDVIEGISEKLIRRHPHVFGTTAVADSEEVLANWEVIKRAEKGNEDRKSRLDGVPRHLPALAQAMEISKRAAKAGFEWDSIEGVFEKLDEELKELRDALSSRNQDHVAAELGDLLFTVVNVARFAKIDAEDSLRIMVKRFSNRFRSMEAASGQPLENLDQSELEGLWQAAKREELIVKSNLKPS